MKKVITASAVALAIAGVGIFGISQAFAQNTAGSDAIAQKIAQRFNLNQADVQKVFEEHHTERMVKHQERLAARLSQLVSEGKITEQQKSLLSAKMKEMHASKSSQKEQLKNLTPEERKAEMEKKRQEFEAWLKAQGIDPSVIGHGVGMKGHKMRMR